MAKLYVRRIRDKNIEFTINDVPERWKEEVQAILDGEDHAE